MGSNKELESTSRRRKARYNSKGLTGPKDTKRLARTKTQIYTNKLKNHPKARPTPGPAHPNQNPNRKAAPATAAAQNTAAPASPLSRTSTLPDVEASGQEKPAYDNRRPPQPGSGGQTTTRLKTTPPTHHRRRTPPATKNNTNSRPPPNTTRRPKHHPPPRSRAPSPITCKERQLQHKKKQNQQEKAIRTPPEPREAATPHRQRRGRKGEYQSVRRNNQPAQEMSTGGTLHRNTNRRRHPCHRKPTSRRCKNEQIRDEEENTG